MSTRPPVSLIPSSLAAIPSMSDVTADLAARGVIDPLRPSDGRVMFGIMTAQFSAALAAGGLVATLVDPYAGLGLGTTTYTDISGDTQLALSGSTIVVGSGSVVAGTTYAKKIRAVSGDGTREVSETLTFKAVVLPITISGRPSSATLGSGYSFTPATANGSGTKTFAYAGSKLSDFGLSFDTTTGAITASSVSGVPGAVVGAISVTDSSGTAILPVSITVAAAGVTALGPTTATYTATASAGSAVLTFTGLASGETVTAISPNDGRLAIGGAGATVVKGLSASSAGTASFTFTTSLGRTLTTVVTIGAGVTNQLMVAGSGPQVANFAQVRSSSFNYEASNVLIALGPTQGTGLWLLFSNRFAQSGNLYGPGNTVTIEAAQIIVGSTWNGTAWSGGTVYAVNFGGSASVTLADATDTLANVPGYVPTPNDVIRLETFATCPAGGKLPCHRDFIHPQLGEGVLDGGSTYTTGRVGSSAWTFFNNGSFSGGAFTAAAVFTDVPATTATGFSAGDSRTWGSGGHFEFCNARGVHNFMAKMFDDPTLVRMPVWDVSSFGASFNSFNSSQGGTAMGAWVQSVCTNLLGGSPAFTRAVLSYGTNDLAGSAVLSQMQARANTAAGTLKAINPAAKVFLDTVGPTVTAPTVGGDLQGPYATTETGQTSWVKPQQGPDPSDRSNYNVWLRAGNFSGFANIDGTFDTVSVYEGTTTLAKIKPTGVSSTVAVAITANSTKQVTVADATGFVVGDNVIFEIADGTNIDVHGDYVVTAIASNVLTLSTRNVIKAHAVGATIHTTRSLDNLHFSPRTQIEQTALAVGQKAARLA